MWQVVAKNWNWNRSCRLVHSKMNKLPWRRGRSVDQWVELSEETFLCSSCHTLHLRLVFCVAGAQCGFLHTCAAVLLACILALADLLALLELSSGMTRGPLEFFSSFMWAEYWVVKKIDRKNNTWYRTILLRWKDWGGFLSWSYRSTWRCRDQLNLNKVGPTEKQHQSLCRVQKQEGSEVVQGTRRLGLGWRRSRVPEVDSAILCETWKRFENKRWNPSWESSRRAAMKEDWAKKENTEDWA